jgi:hypothetical protein
VGEPTRPSVDGRATGLGSGPGGGDRARMHLDLCERIESGSYLVDPGLVAEAMVRRMAREGVSAVLVPAQAGDDPAPPVQEAEAGSFGDTA